MWFSPVAFGLPDLLIELFYIGVPVVGMDGRSLGRCTVTWLPNFLGWVDLRSYGALRAVIIILTVLKVSSKSRAVEVMAHQFILFCWTHLIWNEKTSHFHQQTVILIHIIKRIKINFFSEHDFSTWATQSRQLVNERAWVSQSVFQSHCQ